MKLTEVTGSSEGFLLTTDGTEWIWAPMPQLPNPDGEAEKRRCDCCGSREFRQHAGVRICSYCRTEG